MRQIKFKMELYSNSEPFTSKGFLLLIAFGLALLTFPILAFLYIANSIQASFNIQTLFQLVMYLCFLGVYIFYPKWEFNY